MLEEDLLRLPVLDGLNRDIAEEDRAVGLVELRLDLACATGLKGFVDGDLAARGLVVGFTVGLLLVILLGEARTIHGLLALRRSLFLLLLLSSKTLKVGRLEVLVLVAKLPFPLAPFFFCCSVQDSLFDGLGGTELLLGARTLTSIVIVGLGFGLRFVLALILNVLFVRFSF